MNFAKIYLFEIFIGIKKKLIKIIEKAEKKIMITYILKKTIRNKNINISDLFFKNLKMIMNFILIQITQRNL